MFKKLAIASALVVSALVAQSSPVLAWADAATTSGGFSVNERGILQVGATEAANVRVPAGSSREDTISYPNAKYIAVRFADFRLPPGDEVIVRSEDGAVAYSYTDRGRDNAGSFFASYIPGSKAIVQYIARSAPALGDHGTYGYAIPAFARGFPPRQTESVCGVDDSVPAKCYASGGPNADALPLAYQRSQAVARLLINGTSLCTGWLAGSEGHLFTNQHCITEAGLTANTDIEFAAESGSCSEQCKDQLGCKGRVVTTTSTFITNSETHDYAVVQLPRTADVAQYGFLQLRAAGPVAQERIYIPQHPVGWAKRIAGVVDGGAPAVVEKVGATLSCGTNQVGYSADTQGGSSGSPVLAAADNAVVALHHCGGCNNHAVDIRDVLADLASKNIVIKDLLAGPTTPTPTSTTPAPTTPTPKPTTPTPKPTTPTPKPTTPVPGRCAGLSFSQCYDADDCYWSWWRGECRDLN